MKRATKRQFIKGFKEFQKYERRDAMYRMATFLIKHFWGKPKDMADGLGVLLLTWNQAFYRYGSFDFDRLEKYVAKNLSKLEKYRKRNIGSFSRSDEKEIKFLFNQFLESLKIDSGKGKNRKSPVAVAKALHLMAPDFFPLWDQEIATAYQCYYDENPAEKYILFCHKMKQFAAIVKRYSIHSYKSTIKLIDEYNYAKYTKEWV